jgi:hypothetical protein
MMIFLVEVILVSIRKEILMLLLLEILPFLSIQELLLLENLQKHQYADEEDN